MKMELARLQNNNLMLSEQLSVTKIKTDESLQHKHQYASQLKHLQNEREKIVNDITQLELESVGDSALTPIDCTVEDILTSLDRVRKSFKEITTKNSSLERTLLKVQTSSQLLLSKADEAKKIVEREKQKIISEKEDAIIDKQNMEAKLFDLKAKLEKQIANDKEVIENLESTINNQKLIIDRINKSTQDYISKLKEELQTLKDLYKDSVERIGEVQEKLQSVTDDKSHLLKTVAEITEDLRNKTNEVAELQNELDTLKSKKISHRNVETQVKVNNVYQIDGIQPENEYVGKMQTAKSSEMMRNTKSIAVMVKELPPEKKHTQPEMKLHNSHFVNEVEAAVLDSTVELPFDLVRTSYVDYKMKLLSPGRLEQHSISCLIEEESNENVENTSNAPRKPSNIGKKTGNHLIDIYNRQSIETTSSKENIDSENIDTSKTVSDSQGKTTRYTAAAESYETVSNIISKFKDNKMKEESSSDKSTEKDFFVIYKDSDSSYNNNKEQKKSSWSGNKHPEIVIEAMTVHPSPKKGGGYGMTRRKRVINEDAYISSPNEDNYDESNLKQKLKINVPRVIADSASVLSTSDVDKKSLDSYTLANYSFPEQYSDSNTKVHDGLDDKTFMVSLPTISDEDNQYMGSYNYLSMGSDEDAVLPTMKQRNAFETDNGGSKRKDSNKKATAYTPFKKESHHKLSRVGADVLLLKAEQDQKIPQIGMRQNFGILDTVQGEVSPGKESYNGGKELRKSRSDERYNLLKKGEKSDSPYGLSDQKLSFTDYKILSSSDKSHQKSYTERSIMAKLDINNDYEIQINTLTKALVNIEKDYKKKIEAIKKQYDNNIKSIINEHNQGVKSIQSLHEETLQDIIKLHESEVENLRAMSMEAMKKADKLEKENRALKTKAKVPETICLDEVSYTTQLTKNKLHLR